MIEARQKDGAFLDDVARTRNDTADPFRVWWLGQSGFLLQYRGKHLLFDPYLSDSLTRKYANTDKPHVRMTEQVVDPGCLDFVDVVTSSHAHTDHLDPETLQRLADANPGLNVVFPESIREVVRERIGARNVTLIGLDGGDRIEVEGFRLTAVPAAHNQVERDGNGRCRFLGYVAEFGNWCVYHSGDTLRHAGLVSALRSFDIDLAFLPINGNRPERRVAGNLSGREAATLARDIGAGAVIPCHFEMFEFNTESPEEFVAKCRILDQPCVVLRAGESWSPREKTTNAPLHS